MKQTLWKVFTKTDYVYCISKKHALISRRDWQQILGFKKVMIKKVTL